MSKINNVMTSELKTKLDFNCWNCDSEVNIIFGTDRDQICDNCQKKYSSTDIEKVLHKKTRNRYDSITIYDDEKEKIKQKFENDKIDRNKYNDELKKLYEDEYKLERTQEKYSKSEITKKEYVDNVEYIEKNKSEVQNIKSKYKENQITEEEFYNRVIDLYEKEEPNSKIHSVINKNSPSIRIREGKKIVMAWGCGKFTVTGAGSEKESKEFAKKVVEYIDGQLTNDSFNKTTSSKTYPLEHGINLRQLYKILLYSDKFEDVSYEPEVWHILESSYAGEESNNIKISTSGSVTIHSSKENHDKLFDILKNIIHKNKVNIDNNKIWFEKKQNKKKTNISKKELSILKKHNKKM